MNTNFHTESRMRENCTYGSMRGRAHPTRASRSTLHPSEWCLRRRAQIGEGRVYGSAAFVMGMACSLGHCFRAKNVGAHGLAGLPPEAGASVHGWKLAAADARTDAA